MEEDRWMFKAPLDDACVGIRLIRSKVVDGGHGDGN
jgi:hypothetical protein